MDWFRISSGLGLLIVLASVVFHALRARPSRPAAAGAGQARGWRRWVSGAALAAMTLGLVASAATGFASVFLFGSGTLSGWLLLIHFAAAPLFLAGLAGVVILEGERHRPSCGPDAQGGQHKSAAASAPPQGAAPGALERAVFWLLAAFGLSTGLSIAVCLEAFFSAETQYTLYAVHRVSAFLVTAACIWFMYLRARRRR
jgi:hypothetical protein